MLRVSSLSLSLSLNLCTERCQGTRRPYHRHRSDSRAHLHTPSASSRLYLHVGSKVLSGLQAVQIEQSRGVVEAVLLQAVTDALLEGLPTDSRVITQTAAAGHQGHHAADKQIIKKGD